MYICKQYLNLYNLQEQDVDTKASINLNNVLNQNLNLMKEFEVFTTDGKVTYSFPTDASEIDAPYLTAITANIHVAPHHTLVGLVYRERVSTIVMTYKQKKKGLDVGINPIFIKAGETDSNFISSLEIKDKLIIPTSMLQLGHHVNVPKNELSIDRFISTINNDNEIGKRAITANFPVCFVDFKIVPNTDIVGAYHGKLEVPHKYISIESYDDMKSE